MSIERLVEHLAVAWQEYEHAQDDEDAKVGIREEIIEMLNDLAEEIEEDGEYVDLPPAQVVASFFANE